MFEKIKSFINEWVSRIKAAYEGIEPDSREAKIVKNRMLDVLDELHELWNDALLDASQAYKASEGQKNSTQKGVRYKLREDAQKNVQNALNNLKFREDVILTDNSPSIISSQKNAKNLPLVMKPSHLRENILTEAEAKKKGLKVNKTIHYHGLGEKLFLSVINDLENVELAYRGTKEAENPSRRENYFLLISQHQDENGRTINVPIYINELGQYNRVYFDVNKIGTVFGRENINKYIQNEIKKGNLVRIKNRSTSASERAAYIADGYSKNASTNIISKTNTESQEENSEKTTFSLRNSEDRVFHIRAVFEHYKACCYQCKQR